MFSAPAYGQEKGFFGLLDEDRRREFILEIGPSFMSDPVFSEFRDEAGLIHPATQVNLKTPRHISATFAWRLNNWLRVEAGLNFNAVDFDGATPVSAAQEDEFDVFVIDNLRNQTAIGQISLLDRPDDEDGICGFLNSSISVYCLVSNTVYNRLIQNGDEDATAREQARAQADVAVDLADDGAFELERRTYAAEGTFFSLSSFLSAYVDIPLSSGLWLYSGGGVGLAWSHVKDGFYSRESAFDITNTAEIRQEIESNLELTGNFSELGRAFAALQDSRSQRNSIISTVTSFALTGSVGFRSELFEGLVLDSGYQIIWTQKGLYRGADEKITHLLRVGFVFNY